MREGKTFPPHDGATNHNRLREMADFESWLPLVAAHWCPMICCEAPESERVASIQKWRLLNWRRRDDSGYETLSVVVSRSICAPGALRPSEYSRGVTNAAYF